MSNRYFEIYLQLFKLKILLKNRSNKIVRKLCKYYNHLHNLFIYSGTSFIRIPKLKKKFKLFKKVLLNKYNKYDYFIKFNKIFFIYKLLLKFTYFLSLNWFKKIYLLPNKFNCLLLNKRLYLLKNKYVKSIDHNISNYYKKIIILLYKYYLYKIRLLNNNKKNFINRTLSYKSAHEKLKRSKSNGQLLSTKLLFFKRKSKRFIGGFGRGRFKRISKGKIFNFKYILKLLVKKTRNKHLLKKKFEYAVPNKKLMKDNINVSTSEYKKKLKTLVWKNSYYKTENNIKKALNFKKEWLIANRKHIKKRKRRKFVNLPPSFILNTPKYFYRGRGKRRRKEKFVFKKPFRFKGSDFMGFTKKSKLFKKGLWLFKFYLKSRYLKRKFLARCDKYCYCFGIIYDKLYVLFFLQLLYIIFKNVKNIFIYYVDFWYTLTLRVIKVFVFPQAYLSLVDNSCNFKEFIDSLFYKSFYFKNHLFGYFKILLNSGNKLTRLNIFKLLGSCFVSKRKMFLVRVKRRKFRRFKKLRYFKKFKYFGKYFGKIKYLINKGLRYKKHRKRNNLKNILNIKGYITKNNESINKLSLYKNKEKYKKTINKSGLYKNKKKYGKFINKLTLYKNKKKHGETINKLSLHKNKEKYKKTINKLSSYKIKKKYKKTINKLSLYKIKKKYKKTINKLSLYKIKKKRKKIFVKDYYKTDEFKVLNLFNYNKSKEYLKNCKYSGKTNNFINLKIS